LTEPAIEQATLNNGEIAVSVRHWIPARPAFGSVNVLHGIQSHSGWYLNSCGRIADAGFEVWAPDRRGSGLNEAHRGDAPSFRRLLDDAAEFLARARRPRFLVGISWGGKLAVALQRRHPNLCDGLVLIAPGLAPRVGLGVAESLQVLTMRWIRPSTLFEIPLTEPELFTANKNYQQWIRCDSLALRKATARFLFESARLGFYCRLAALNVTIPTLVLLAECDRIVDNARVRSTIRRFASTDVTVLEYPGAHHTLEFEPQGPPFMADVVSWLTSRLPRKRF
jgi:alpha-beta hydrolase superfamily lysophospholipase